MKNKITGSYQSFITFQPAQKASKESVLTSVNKAALKSFTKWWTKLVGHRSIGSDHEMIY
ncbi:MAG: hypothetical protein QM791_07770 [Ferruginibacter sp.]